MTGLIAAFCGLLGLAVGSFLNVVVWRVPRGKSVIRPASRCPSCDTEILARDNLPILSWLVLRARCRHCSVRISAQYPLVEAATAALFVALALKFGAHAALPAFLYLAAIAVTLALIDLDVQKLPNSIVLPSYLIAGVLLALAAIADADGDALLRAAIGMAAYYGLFFLLWFTYPKGMGFGDVKLAGVLGLYLGYLSWGTLVAGIFAGVLAGGCVGIGLMAFAGAGRKTKIPYGPFMLAGALFAVFLGANIAGAYTHATGV